MGVHHQEHHDHDDDHHRPFQTSNKGAHTSSYTADNNTNTKSSGITAEVNGYPFTSDQWKELERQAMIYKYIRDSIPVPSYLLLPTSTPISTGDQTPIFNMNFGFPTKGKDLEPGRCKRTDGKKWRCSRDVAPHHKYCERHLHRGRPRSRKPVEIQSNGNNNKKIRFDRPILPSNTSISPVETPLYLFQPDVSISSHRGSTRCPNRAMEEQWSYTLGNDHIPYNTTSLFQQDFLQESPNLVPFSNFGSLNFGVTQPQIENGLVDAWSSENPHSNESSLFSQGNLSPSYLSLSMGTAAGSDEMDLSIGDTDYENSQISSLSNPVSWMGSSMAGGPLAEVLGGRTIA